MPKQLEFPPDYWLAVIEDTDMWYEETLTMYDVDCTWSVYLFNRNVEHHLCELTPSYELVLVGFDYKGRGVRYDSHPNTFFDVQLGAMDKDPIYMHCREVDSLPPDRLIHIHQFLDQDELDKRPMLAVDCPPHDRHCSVEEECRDPFQSGHWSVFIGENGVTENNIEEVVPDAPD